MKRKFSIGVFLNIFNSDSENWKEQLASIQALRNVEHLEILLEDVSLSSRQITLLKSLTHDYRIILHAPFMDLTLLSPHKQITAASLAVITKALHIGSRLKAELVTIHAERYPHYQNSDYAQERVIEILTKLKERTDLILAIENLSFSGNTQLAYPSTVSQLLDLSAQLPKSYGLTIDTGHLLKDGLSVYSAVKKLHPKIRNFHLHDGYPGAAHLALGKGLLNTKKFINTLLAVDYGNFVSLEVVGKKEIEDSWVTLMSLLS